MDDALPYGDSEIGPQRFEIVGDPPVAPDDRPIADFQAADPGTSRRWISRSSPGARSPSATPARATPVCIVSEAFVRRYLAGRDPIGVRVGIDPLFAGLAVPRA